MKKALLSVCRECSAGAGSWTGSAAGVTDILTVDEGGTAV